MKIPPSAILHEMRLAGFLYPLYWQCLFFHFVQVPRLLLFFTLLFLAKARIDAQEGRDDEGEGAGCHDDDEEVAIAHQLLQGAGKEAGNHHRQRHERRAEGIVRGLVFALAVIDKVEHVGGEAEAIAKLLDEDADVDHQQIGGQAIAHVDIDHVGQGDGAHHGPKPIFQSLLRHGNAAENAAERESDDTHRALHEAVFLRRESQSARRMTVHEEEGGHLGEQALGHAVEEHEQDAEHHLLPGHLGDERDKHLLDATPQLRHIHLLHAPVGFRSGQDIAVPQPKGDEQTRDAIEHQAPGIFDGGVAEDELQIAGYHHQHALPEDGGEAVEGAADAHEHGLLMVVKLEHVVAVGGDVVGGAAERHEGEKAERGLEPETRLERERHTAKGGADEQLHGHDPPALGLHQVDEGAPQGLDDPWQIEPAGVKGDFSVAQSQLLVEYERDGHHRHIGQSFREI